MTGVRELAWLRLVVDAAEARRRGRVLCVLRSGETTVEPWMDGAEQVELDLTGPEVARSFDMDDREFRGVAYRRRRFRRVVLRNGLGEVSIYVEKP